MPIDQPQSEGKVSLVSGALHKPRPRKKQREAQAWLQQVPLLSKRGFFQVVVLLLGAKILPFGENILIIVACAHTFRGNRQAIEGLAAVFLLLMGGKAWGMTSLITDLRWVAVLGAAVSAFRSTYGKKVMRNQLKWLIVAILVFSCTSMLTSLQTSKYPTISVFKIVSFTVGSVAIVLNIHYSNQTTKGWLNYMSGWFAALLFCGVLSFLWGGGYTKNGIGFEGAFGHPQTNGVVMGVAAMHFLARYLLVSKRGEYFGLLGLLCIGVVFLSQSRTGMLAAMLGGGVGVMCLWMKYRVQLARTRLFRHVAVSGLAMIAIVAVLPSQFSSLVGEFVAKEESSSASSVAEAFVESRQELLDRSMSNFKKHPMLGIGFGAPSSNFDRIQMFMGLPVGASVEKGFLPTAILEETGVVGAGLFLVLLVTVFVAQLSGGSPHLLWPMAAAIFCNFGEAMFFSVGGLGMFLWIMIGIAVAGGGASATQTRKSGQNRRRMAKNTNRVEDRGGAVR